MKREGAGQWVLLGPPNAGKSSLLAALTHAHPEIGDYPFTTRAPLPGMMAFEDVQVQLVDTPAVAEGHTEPWLPNLAHDADGVLLVVDVTADDAEAAARLLHDLLARARVWPRVRPLPADAPSFLQPKPVLVLGNKSEDDDGTFAALASEAIGADLPFFPVSALTGAGLEPLREVLFRELKRIRVYPQGARQEAGPREAVRPSGGRDDPRPRRARPQGDRRAPEVRADLGPREVRRPAGGPPPRPRRQGRRGAARLKSSLPTSPSGAPAS